MALTNMLTGSGILTTGSAYTFSDGKHFNYCKKRHSLLSVALQIMHFERFLEYSGSLGNGSFDLEKKNSRRFKTFQRTKQIFSENLSRFHKSTM